MNIPSTQRLIVPVLEGYRTVAKLLLVGHKALVLFQPLGFLFGRYPAGRMRLAPGKVERAQFVESIFA
jgi:hypothetical protein